jgi:hypothetical protein
MILLNTLAKVAPSWMGQPSWLMINPGSEMIGRIVPLLPFGSQLSAALFQAFFIVFLLLLLVIVVRSERFALAFLWLLMTVLTTLVSQASLVMIPFTALVSFLALFTLKRYGLLALASAIFFAHLGIFYPITLELTSWYAINFVMGLGFALLLAAYGFYTSLGGQALFSGRLLDD